MAAKVQLPPEVWRLTNIIYNAPTCRRVETLLRASGAGVEHIDDLARRGWITGRGKGNCEVDLLATPSPKLNRVFVVYTLKLGQWVVGDTDNRILRTLGSTPRRRLALPSLLRQVDCDIDTVLALATRKYIDVINDFDTPAGTFAPSYVSRYAGNFTTYLTPSGKALIGA